MELSSKMVRLTGLLCVASTLQGIPSLFASVPNMIPSIAQQSDVYMLTGTVIDEAGVPVIGANIIEKERQTVLSLTLTVISLSRSASIQHSLSLISGIQTRK